MKKFLLGLCISALLFGCYPKGPEYISDLDLIATNYAEDFDFEAQDQFFLLDTVVHITDENYNGGIDTTYDNLLLSEVRAHMLERGYEEVNTAGQADLVLNISAWSNTTVNYYQDWWYYWGWSYPGYGPGWGYPGGGYTYVQSYTYGTVLMEMQYPAGANLEEKTIPLVWSGLINGLLDGSKASIEDRIEDGINQIFDQSPYVQSN